MSRWSTLGIAASVLVASAFARPLSAATVQPASVAAQKSAAKATTGSAAAASAPAASVSSGATSAETAPPPQAEPAAVADSAEQDSAKGAEQGQPEPARTWLRRSAQAEPEPTRDDKSSVPLGALAVVIVAGLVGGALVLRARRGKSAPWLPAAPVRVLSTTRIGPKASLVTVDVYGRVILLGVTEETVSELGWVEGGPDSKLDEANEDTETGLLSGQTSGDRSRESRSGFNQVFSSVFGGGERSKERTFRGNPEVAALIAARETRDTVSTGAYRRSTAAERRTGGGARAVGDDAPRVEAQVAGLMRRRR